MSRQLSDSALRRLGEGWANKDYRSNGAPRPRYGNLTLDQAYARTWRKLTGSDPWGVSEHDIKHDGSCEDWCRKCYQERAAGVQVGLDTLPKPAPRELRKIADMARPTGQGGQAFADATRRTRTLGEQGMDLRRLVTVSREIAQHSLANLSQGLDSRTWVEFCEIVDRLRDLEV